jgi:hypothetical protein
MQSRIQQMSNGKYRAQYKRFWVPFWWFTLTHAGQYADTDEVALFNTKQEARQALLQFALELEPVKQPKLKPIATTNFVIDTQAEAEVATKAEAPVTYIRSTTQSQLLQKSREAYEVGMSSEPVASSSTVRMSDSRDAAGTLTEV